MSEPPERRRTHRYPVSLRVLYKLEDTAFFLDTETVNVSADGAYVRTRRYPLEEGTKVALIFNDLPGFESNKVIRGVVSRTRAEATELEPRGMGIRFEDLADEVRKQLVASLKRLQED